MNLREAFWHTPERKTDARRCARRHVRLAAMLALGLAALAPGCDARSAPLAPTAPQRAARPPLAAATDDPLDLALALAREDRRDLDDRAVREAIDALADAYRTHVGSDASPAERADGFAWLLFDHAGFRSIDELESLDALHVDTVLSRRAGYCLSLSIVALAIAHRVEEPLHAVAMPNHVFVRYDDGDHRRNIELTQRGIERTDEALHMRLDELLPEDTIYLTNLPADALEALLLHNHGFVALSEGRLELARADLERAAAILPELPEIHRNLGVLHGEAGRLGDAVSAFERALSLNPADADALVNLALVEHASGDLDAALASIRIAAILAPARTRPRELEALWTAERAEGGGVHALSSPPAGLRPGLLGAYYAGRSLERLVTRRVDAGLDFSWERGRPAPGVPRDEFSVRWTGWLEIPRSGTYTFFVVANDGVRIDVAGERIVDQWRSVGYSSWTGTVDVRLDAGWYPLRVEYFDDADNARLVCMLSRDGDEYPLDLREHLHHVPER